MQALRGCRKVCPWKRFWSSSTHPAAGFRRQMLQNAWSCLVRTDYKRSVWVHHFRSPLFASWIPIICFPVIPSPFMYVLWQENKVLKFLSFMWNPLSWVMEAAAVMALVLVGGVSSVLWRSKIWSLTSDLPDNSWKNVTWHTSFSIFSIFICLCSEPGSWLGGFSWNRLSSGYQLSHQLHWGKQCRQRCCSSHVSLGTENKGLYINKNWSISFRSCGAQRTWVWSTDL